MYFLDLEIVRYDARIVVNQRKYTIKLLEDLGFLATKISNTTFNHATNLSSAEGTPLKNTQSYRRLLKDFFI